MISQRGKAYRSFFQKLIDELREKHNFTNARAAQPRNFYHFTSGIIPGVYYDAFFAKGERVVASLLIDVKDGERNRSIFNRLKQDRELKIEAEFGSKLYWSSTDDVRACSIRFSRDGSDRGRRGEASRDSRMAHRKPIENKKVFSKHLRETGNSQNKLAALADEALAEFRRGETKSLDELL